MSAIAGQPPTVAVNCRDIFADTPGRASPEDWYQRLECVLAHSVAKIRPSTAVRGLDSSRSFTLGTALVSPTQSTSYTAEVGCKRDGEY